MKTITSSTEKLNWLQRSHRRLLPQDPEIGLMPYIWLCYLFMYFIPFLFVDFTSKQIILSVVCIAVFLVLYFRVFWVTDKQLFYYMAATWTIGYVLALHDMPGASVFTVYAAAFTANFKKAKTAFISLAVIVVFNLVFCYLTGVSPYIFVPGSLFALIIGVSNIFLSTMANKNRQIKASQEEIKSMATAAERERIARDLHDLIGHTFSAINVKSQLAVKLINHDIQKASQEIQEIEKMSRDSLAQVRETVSGYRQRDLATELIQARVLLESLDIKVSEQVTPIDALHLDTETNTTLAYIVRELTTNIMRHAQATACEIKLQSNQQLITLTISDDGQATTFKAGSGLKGISERAEQLSGQAEFKTNPGFSATVKIPNT